MRILTYYVNTTLDIVSYHPINYCQDKFMDRLTVDKIIEINCNKNSSMHQEERKNLKKMYDDFTSSIDDVYQLTVSKKLSEINTLVVVIKNKKERTNKEISLFCFDKYYYLQSIDGTFITSSLDKALEAVDNYFYK